MRTVARNHIIISNSTTKEYFFSVDHRQKITDGWVAHSMSVRRYSKQEFAEKFYGDYKEIPNPEPNYQA